MLIGLALAATGLVSPASADETTQVWEYTGHNDAAQECLARTGECAAVLVASFCQLAVCDYIGGTEVDLVLEDATGLPVGAFYLVARGCGPATPDCLNFRTVTSGRLCGSATGIVVPPGSDYIFIVPDGPSHGPADCAGVGAPGIATTGTLTIRTR